MGHDEYWTNTMRDVVLGARDAGTNLAFLGANTMYWRIRLEPGAEGPARVVVGYRHSAHLDPLYAQGSVEATAMFREPPVPRPEHDLLGMQYECYPVDTDYVVASPGWWGFRGTGVRRGDHVPGLVGPEADRVYPDGRLPRPLQVLSHSPYSCRGVTTTDAVGLLHGRLGGRGVQRRHAALGLRDGRPVRAPAGRRHAGVHPDGDRHPGHGVRPRPRRRRGTRPGTTSRSSTSPRSTRSRRAETGQAASVMMIAMGPLDAARGGPRASARRSPWRRSPPVARRAARPTTSRRPTAESAALRVQTVTGAERLDQQTRTEVEGAVGDVLSDYVVAAFLGEFPRQEFVRAFEPFTSVAARKATRDID